MSTIATPRDFALNDEVTERHARYALTGTNPATLMVETRHSTYTVVVHGADDFGYQRATVVCPAHTVTGASMAVLSDVTCRVLDDRLVVVDSDDVRRTLLRTTDIISTHVVALTATVGV